MMKIVLMLFISGLWWTSVQGSTCHVPNVYEFCSALATNGVQTGQSDITQHNSGRPGKRGAIGMTGPRGEKGEQGEQGSCQHMEERIKSLEAEVKSKVELIPKLVYCSMGMKNGEIPDSAITASSKHSHRFNPGLGRLDARIIIGHKSSDDTSGGCWCPSSDAGQWIQVDLGIPKSVSGVVTQGRPTNRWGSNCWVKTFKITYGNTVEHMSTVSVDGVEKIFNANTDKETRVINKFPEPISSRYIRLHVLSWNTVSPWIRPCLRMELLRGECHEML